MIITILTATTARRNSRATHSFWPDDAAVKLKSWMFATLGILIV